jgi:hypothetical protein
MKTLQPSRFTKGSSNTLNDCTSSKSFGSAQQHHTCQLPIHVERASQSPHQPTPTCARCASLFTRDSVPVTAWSLVRWSAANVSTLISYSASTNWLFTIFCHLCSKAISSRCRFSMSILQMQKLRSNIFSQHTNATATPQPTTRYSLSIGITYSFFTVSFYFVFF